MQTTQPLRALPHHRTVAEVMSTTLVTVSPDTGFKEATILVTERHIGALPVLAPDGTLVGIVSESDLLSKERRLDEPVFGTIRRSWREEHARAESLTIGALMTTPVVSVTSDATLQQAARVMHQRRVRQLCVTDDSGHLLGIVTRGDLLRGFIRADDEIAAEIRDGVMLRTMWVDPTGIRVEVREGVVRLIGEMERRSDADILAAMVRGLDGVVGVETELTWRLDDRALAPSTNARV